MRTCRHPPLWLPHHCPASSMCVTHPRPGPACGAVSNATAGTVHQRGMNEVADAAAPQRRALASARHGMRSEFPNQNMGRKLTRHPCMHRLGEPARTARTGSCVRRVWGITDPGDCVRILTRSDGRDERGWLVNNWTGDDSQCRGCFPLPMIVLWFWML